MTSAMSQPSPPQNKEQPHEAYTYEAFFQRLQWMFTDAGQARPPVHVQYRDLAVKAGGAAASNTEASQVCSW